MKYPLSTGQCARFLNVTEPRLADLVRRGKVYPAPPVISGRRVWDEIHVVRAARALDGLNADRRDNEEVA